MFQWHRARQTLTTTNSRALCWNTWNSVPHRTCVLWMGFSIDSTFLERVGMRIRAGNCSHSWGHCVNRAEHHSLTYRISGWCRMRGNFTRESSKVLSRYYGCSPRLLTHTAEDTTFSKSTSLLSGMLGTCDGAPRNTPQH